MKTSLHFLMALLLGFAAYAQETTVEISMQPSYTDQVYYKLSTETSTAFPSNSWDIAFLRTSAFDMGIRVNSAITVYEASANKNDWETINITNEASWTALYNTENSWAGGAFDNGSATYGWGEYNMASHKVVGSIIFVLKYQDETYRKFIIEQFSNGYSIKYSTWSAGTSTWGEDQLATIANSTNPDNRYNYYSLQNNTEVVAEPAISDWDFVFTKYTADYFGDATVFYPVTGVLHNDDVTVAQNEEFNGMPDTPSLTYSTEINTIGYDWKTSGADFSYTVHSEQAYYIKYSDGTIYRLYFTGFEGGATGNISFAFENITEALGIADVNAAVAFGIYPNPSTDKKVNLVYDVSQWDSEQNTVSIFSVTGAQVYQTTLSNQSGLYNKQLDLSQLKSGVYLLQFSSGTSSITKKLILN